MHISDEKEKNRGSAVRISWCGGGSQFAPGRSLTLHAINHVRPGSRGRNGLTSPEKNIPYWLKTTLDTSNPVPYTNTVILISILSFSSLLLHITWWKQWGRWLEALWHAKLISFSSSLYSQFSSLHHHYFMSVKFVVNIYSLFLSLFISLPCQTDGGIVVMTWRTAFFHNAL